MRVWHERCRRPGPYHGQPATPGDPWSWHRCATGAIREHGWGMAARRRGGAGDVRAEKAIRQGVEQKRLRPEIRESTYQIFKVVGGL